MPAWIAATAIGLTLLLVGGLAVALDRVRRRSARAVEQNDADTAFLRARVEDIERRLVASEGATTPVGMDEEYVITRLGAEPSPSRAAPPVPGPLFTDMVLRESVVQAASMAAGLRRALAPEIRHRIRFEMKREVKRARKQRRIDLRKARRESAARQRAAVDLDDPARDSAA